jgi:uncharacterized protein (DUF2236 family)
MAWRVHADFTAMMVGGLLSLTVQSLHPRALSAVWNHSDFRLKLKERLGRTAYFVAATTYGSNEPAMRVIDQVNTIHAHVQGLDLQGRPYVANEPILIRWVHLVEVVSLLNAYQQLSHKPLSPLECDQYILEMTQVGHLLEATDLPATWPSTLLDLEKFRPELSFDQRARDTTHIIKNYPVDRVDKPFMQLFLRAAFDVMPKWTLQLMGNQAACSLNVMATRCALMVASWPVQWALDQQGVRSVSRLRVAG